MANTDFSILLKAIIDKTGINTELKQVQQIVNKYSIDIIPELKTASLRNQLKTVSQEIAKDFNKTFGTNLTGNDIFKAFENQAKQAEKAIKDTQKAFAELRKEAYQSIGQKSPELQRMAEYYSNLEKQTSEYAKTQKQMYLTEQEAYKINERYNTSIELTKIRADAASKSFSAYLSKLQPQALKTYSAEINEVSNAFAKAAETGNKTDYSKATASLARFKSHMKEAGMETESFTSKIKENISGFSNWYIIGNIVSGVVRNFKASINTIKEVDTLITEISKTSELSSESLNKLGLEAYDYASRYGKTVQNYLSAFLEMSRAGFENAKDMAELSILAQSAGDMTAEVANNYIVATNAAYDFKNNVQALTEVLDGQNKISNETAIEMSDIAAATSEAASMAAQYGVKIDELTSLIATAGSRTRETGAEVGTALKSIFTNLQNTTNKKIVETLDSVGISMTKIVDGSKQLKTPIELLKELSDVFNTLSEGSVLKANILTNIGGKYHANTLSAILTGQTDYLKILQMYAEGANSAAKEAEKTANSLEGKLNKLSNTWDRTINNIVNSDLLKFLVDAGTSTIDLVDKTNLLQTAFIGLAVFSGYKGISALATYFQNAAIEATMLGNAMKAVQSSSFGADIQNMITVLTGLNQKQMLAVLSTESMKSAFQALSREEQINILTQAGLSSATADTTAATLTMSSAQSAAVGTSISLSGAIKGLWTVIKANPLGAVITLITTAYSIFSLVSSNVKQKQEELRASISKNVEESKSLTNEITSLASQYKELANAVKTDISVKNDLLSVQDKLLTKLGFEGQSIDTLIKKYGSLDEAIKQGMLSQLKDSELDLTASFNQAKNDLLQNAKIGWFDENQNEQIFSSKKHLNELLDILKAIGIEVRKGENAGTAYFNLTGDNSTVEGVLKNYNDLKNAMQAISDSGIYSSKEALESSDLYKELEERYMSLKDSVEAYNSSITDLNTNIAQQQMLIALQGQEIPDTKAEFDQFKKSLTETAIASGKFIGTQEQITASIEKMLMSQPEFIQFFDIVKNTGNSITNTFSSFKDALANEDISNALDDYQESLKKIQTTLKSNDLSSSEIVDLMQEFSNFDWESYGVTGEKGVGNLNAALNGLAKELKDNIEQITGYNKAIQSMYEEAITASIGVEDLSLVTDAVNKKTELSSEQIKYLTERYSGLSKYLVEVKGGWYLEEEAINTVNTAITDLKLAYINAQTEMSSIIQTESYKRLSAIGIELTSIGTLYEFYQALSSTPGVSNISWQDIQNVQKYYELLETAKNAFSTPPETKTGSGYDKEFSNSIDWAIQSIQNLQNAVDNAQDKLSDTIGYDKQTNAINNLISAQEALKKGYQSAANSYKQQYNSISGIGKYKKLIEGGATFTASDFTDEDLYNQVAKAQDFWNSYQSMLAKAKDVAQDIADINDKILSDAKKSQEEIIKSQFDTLEYEHDMDLKTDKQYWDEKLALAEKYYTENGKVLDEYLDEYRDIEIGYYQWTVKQAEEAAKKQEEIAEKLKDKYTDLINDIADEIKDEKDRVLDELEEAHETEINRLKKQKDAYKEIIEAQLEALEIAKDEEEYKKKIAKHTSEISNLESRKAELEKAAQSGDRTAIKELNKLNEELAKKKEDLADDQTDHEYDLQKEALNKALDANNKLFDAKIDSENERYKIQKSNIEKLYDQEIELIKKAAQYTEQEFGRVLDDIVAKLSNVGVKQSSSYIDSIKQSQSGIADTDLPVSTSTRAAILAILRNGKGKDYGEEASALAAYTRDNYGAPISKAQAVEIAKLLGVEGINSVSDLTGNDANKNKILEALRKAGFFKGGYVDLDTNTIHGLGEHGIALVRRKELVLNEGQSKLFKELMNNIKPLNNLVKLISPNVSNLTTNNSPTFKFDNMIQINGTVTGKDASTQIKSAGDDIIKKIMDVVRVK